MIKYKSTKSILKWEHVMRHKPGLYNGTWSDMFIETTFKRYEHARDRDGLR